MIHDSVLLHGWQYLFDANRTSLLRKDVNVFYFFPDYSS
jgi:hypothetical protein